MIHVPTFRIIFVAGEERKVENSQQAEDHRRYGGIGAKVAHSASCLRQNWNIIVNARYMNCHYIYPWFTIFWVDELTIIKLLLCTCKPIMADYVL